MQPGDLVTLGESWSFNTIKDYDVGLVIGVRPWTDQGAPNRNFGVHVHVLWSNGVRCSYEEDELELIR